MLLLDLAANICQQMLNFCRRLQNVSPTHPPKKKSDEGLETETILRLNFNANCPKKPSNSIGSTFLYQKSPLFGTTFEGWVIRGQLSTAHPSALLSHSHLTPPQKKLAKSFAIFLVGCCFSIFFFWGGGEWLQSKMHETTQINNSLNA